MKNICTYKRILFTEVCCYAIFSFLFGSVGVSWHTRRHIPSKSLAFAPTLPLSTQNCDYLTYALYCTCSLSFLSILGFDITLTLLSALIHITCATTTAAAFTLSIAAGFFHIKLVINHDAS